MSSCASEDYVEITADLDDSFAPAMWEARCWHNGYCVFW